MTNDQIGNGGCCTGACLVQVFCLRSDSHQIFKMVDRLCSASQAVETQFTCGRFLRPFRHQTKTVVHWWLLLLTIHPHFKYIEKLNIYRTQNSYDLTWTQIVSCSPQNAARLNCSITFKAALSLMLILMSKICWFPFRPNRYRPN